MQKLAKFIMIASIIVCGLTMISVGVSPAITSIYIQAPTQADGFVLNIGDSETLSVIINPNNAGNADVMWISSNLNVATISHEGYVNALAAGETIITAKTANNKTDSILLTVKEIPVTTVSLEFEYSAIQTGSTYQLVATIYPENATNKTITWASSNNDVISIDQNGTITAESTGVAVITATSVSNTNAKQSLTIIVKDTIEVSSLSLNYTSLQLYKGTHQSLSCYVNPTNATDKNVTWSSSNSDIVSVSNTGSLTARNAGTATITVTSANGKTQTCTVTVPSVQAEELYFSVSTLKLLSSSLPINNTYQLEYTATSKHGSSAITDKAQWRSSNEDVASIDQNGLLATHTAGTTIIYVTLSGIERSLLINII